MGKEYCDKCKKITNFIFYDGCLGYESFVCVNCGRDIKDIEEEKNKLKR